MGYPPSDVIRWRSVGRAAFWALRERAPFIDGRARFRGREWRAWVEYTVHEKEEASGFQSSVDRAEWLEANGLLAIAERNGSLAAVT